MGSASENHELDWDDVGFDPHQKALEEGRAMGQASGEQAGFRDGQQLGHTKGIEFGMELGFIQGFVNELRNNNNIQHSSERVHRSILALQSALDDFPSPNLMFEHVTSLSTSKSGDDSEGEVTKFDVIAKMQRVRARFKLLTVQLGVGTISLTQVLAAGAKNHENHEVPPSRDW